MSETIKVPKKGAVARLRDFYNKRLRKQPMSPELHETLKSPETKTEQPSNNKKIARTDREVEL